MVRDEQFISRCVFSDSTCHCGSFSPGSPGDLGHRGEDCNSPSPTSQSVLPVAGVPDNDIWSLCTTDLSTQLHPRSILYLNFAMTELSYTFTLEELTQRRRIIYFFRRPESRELIEASVSSTSHIRQGICSMCVSCIYWPGKEDMYITSSDMVDLLEWLVQAPMTHLQRCRTRRSLDSFQPILISKSDPKSFQFARMIRGFRNPKALALRKDSKVFPWRVLQSAITTILRRYSVHVRLRVG